MSDISPLFSPLPPASAYHQIITTCHTKCVCRNQNPVIILGQYSSSAPDAYLSYNFDTEQATQVAATTDSASTVKGIYANGVHIGGDELMITATYANDPPKRVGVGSTVMWNWFYPSYNSRSAGRRIDVLKSMSARLSKLRSNN